MNEIDTYEDDDRFFDDYVAGAIAILDEEVRRTDAELRSDASFAAGSGPVEAPLPREGRSRTHWEVWLAAGLPVLVVLVVAGWNSVDRVLHGVDYLGERPYHRAIELLSERTPHVMDRIVCVVNVRNLLRESSHCLARIARESDEGIAGAAVTALEATLVRLDTDPAPAGALTDVALAERRRRAEDAELSVAQRLFELQALVHDMAVGIDCLAETAKTDPSPDVQRHARRALGLVRVAVDEDLRAVR